ncbi:MAG: magnesium transporter [Ignavibacteriales bacterium]|nr:MAG: magnesium transporter [Ignavibacteriaceae bacterium]MBW7873727.1 magnesium transporter [Ignavibacteria bacterium]MCZ2143952.1 magnesium transporter [Ignavibacteriales bacterium]OQY71252.1 MAG: magnesium transporter [Ignavibacteriales bacterium UTCHB3]MBV6444628.1 Magnesium transporter MgtE [Ignavibacteriaceae bacterium]
MIGKILQPEISELIEQRNLSPIRELIDEWTPADLADLISCLPDNDRAVLFRVLPKDVEIETFEYLDTDDQIGIIKAMGREEVSNVLNEMSPDDRTAFFEELPAHITKQMMSYLSNEERAVASRLLGYPENSVGRLMTPDYLAVEEDWSIKEVLDHIREYGEDTETLNTIYVINEKGQLVDDIRIREFLLNPLHKKVYDLMDSNFISLSAFDDQEEAVEVFKKYDKLSLPVVDSAGVLIGIVTVDDVLDVAEEEATEDIQKLGAVSALEDSYVDTSIPQMIKKRVGWLAVLFISGSLTASAIGIFEAELQKALVLSLFIPLVIASGGNSGSQAATLVTRALSLGEITIHDWWSVMRKEFITGLVLGVILAIIGFFRIAILEFLDMSQLDYWFQIALSVSTALVGVVLWGTFVGSMLPLVLKRLGFDPATSSAPFVSTLVDVTGIIIYFTCAAIFLRGTLL